MYGVARTIFTNDKTKLRGFLHVFIAVTCLRSTTAALLYSMGDANFRTAFPEGKTASQFGSYMALIGLLLFALNSVPFFIFTLYIPHMIIFLFDSRSDVQSVLGFKHMNIYDRQNGSLNPGIRHFPMLDFN